MTLLPLAWRSLWHRRATAVLTLLSIALSVALLLGVERLRLEVRAAFDSTISGTDLVVGPRSSPLPLLLATLFGIGSPTQNLRPETVAAIAAHPRVAWTAPLALGDSHRGFRVLGTTGAYYERFRYGRGQPLALAAGRLPADRYEAVLGAEVAAALGHRVGAALVVSHGAGGASFVDHDDRPFTVVGVLARTGTPVDRTVHVPIDGLEALHATFPGAGASADDPLAGAGGALAGPRAPSVSAMLVGLEARRDALLMARFLNAYPGEPLTALLPGVALAELWQLVGGVERALRGLSGFVLVVGLAGMLVALLASLEQRRREMAVLRAVGARPGQVVGLMVGEAALLTVLGSALGVALLALAQTLGAPLLEARLGVSLGGAAPSLRELALLAAVAAAGALVGAVPAWRVYRYAVADGIAVRF